MPGGRKINVKSGVAAAVGASDADKCVVEVSARAKGVDKDQSRKTNNWAPRIWFRGKKISVTDGKQKEARNALQIAWAKKKKWEDDDWKLEKAEVLHEFRQGVRCGGYS